jgi:hypothetical protein
MSLLSWLRNRTTTPSSPGRRPHCLAARRFRPQLESLERRDVPSTLTVTSAADSGAGSLRAEIAAANPGDTINFSSSLNGQTITLTSGELVLNKSLTIQGPGASQLAISGGAPLRGFNVHASRVFEVIGSGTNVALSGLTITDGNGRGFDSGVGGGILNIDGSTLTVSDCIVSNNRGLQQGGGGIANLGGTLDLVNTTLSGNMANDPNVGGDGGAVYNAWRGQVSMTDCTLSNNSAGGEGGAVWTDAGCSMSVNGCTLSGNLEYNYAGGGPTIRYGNDIFNQSPISDSLMVKDNVFANNTGYLFIPIEGAYVNEGGNTF